jgi:monoamine oxidase
MFEGKVLSEEDAKKLHDEMDAAANLLNEQADKINPDEPWNSPGAADMDKRNMAEWLASVQGSPLLKRAVRSWFEADETVSLEQQSYLAFLTMVKGGGVEKYWSDVETCRCAQGNQALAGKLAERITVKLGMPVLSISCGSNGVMVGCPGNQQFHADDVVLTVPPSVWNTIQFLPELPPALMIQMGTAVKYLSPVKRKFWEESKKGTDSLSDTELQMTWLATEAQSGDAGHVLTCFGGGPSVNPFRNRSADSRRAYVADHLEALLPGFKDNALPQVRYMDWPSDPQVRASYSFAAPGQIMAAGPIFHKGLGRMHFAGEHTCFQFCGYMEGALRSGVDAARRIAKRDGAA